MKKTTLEKSIQRETLSIINNPKYYTNNTEYVE